MHVAIIPDGNRRWAKSKNFAVTKGHEHAARVDNLEQLLKKAKELGITTLSLWIFSTENWKRSIVEREALFSLLYTRLHDLKEIAKKEHVTIRWIGRRDRVPQNIREELIELEEETKKENEEGREDKKNKQHFVFQICFDYGGRDEIIRAVNEAIKKGELQTEESFAKLLDTKGRADPDLIIRTSGEHRLSGFFPYQGTYAELYFVKKHFPDFESSDLEEAIQEFHSRKRRYGGQ